MPTRLGFLAVLVVISSLMASSVAAPAVWRGAEALSRLVSKVVGGSECPLLNPAAFANWAQQIITRKLSTDSEFGARVSIRDARRRHPEIKEQERALHACQQRFAASEYSAELDQLELSIRGAAQAITSMGKFTELGETSDSPNIQSKLDNVIRLLPAKREEMAMNLARRDDLRELCGEWRELREAKERLQALMQETGLAALTSALSSDTKRAGAGRNSRGKSFETLAAEVVETELIPSLARRFGLEVSDVFPIRNIKFGMSSSKGSTSEIDCVLCTKFKLTEQRELEQKYAKAKPWSSGVSFVRCLGVVEVKRNADDLADALIGYQRTLAWLSGADEDLTGPRSDWVTRAYPRGVFDRPFMSNNLVFVRESFADLQRTTPTADTHGHTELPRELFLRDLFFISRDADVELISSKASAWAVSKLGSDERLGPGDCLDDLAAVEEWRVACLGRHAPRLPGGALQLVDIWRKAGLCDQLLLVSTFPTGP